MMNILEYEDFNFDELYEQYLKLDDPNISFEKFVDECYDGYCKSMEMGN